jgi:dihydrodipicolinate synthase/N-acetylneuraminate lyase
MAATESKPVAMRYHQAILISCEIPWDERENLIEPLFREELRRVLRLGFNNLYIFGTAGEGYAVDTPRFRRIVEVFREETSGDAVYPMVGAIGLSTANIVERLSFAHELGFRTFQISLPCWGALNDRELQAFFSGVCGAFPDSRFLHYNLMRAKRVLTAADYRRLADAVPNLAATKNTGLTVQTASALMRGVPEIQHFFSEALFPTGCLHGECSLLSAIGPMLPSKTREFFGYGRAGEIEKLFRLQKEYLRVVDDILAPMMRESRIDGAYDKVLKRLGGFDMPLRLLSPYQGFSEEVFEECRSILHQKYSDWLG